jgi:hypothetical protein
MDAIDTEFVPDDDDIALDEEESDYVPDPRSLWAAEGARAMLVVLARRLGPDFARDVSDELAARTFAYADGCADDRRDGAALQHLLQDKLWDGLFEAKAPN